ncbi:radical SAM protein [Photobacterium kasasachensis]|uniref:radical SAM protein n=1 Tax=Photobacterium kasasachensis TaxID=2910240 RepID=UPI003D12C9E6
MPLFSKDQIKQQEPVDWVTDPLKAARETMKRYGLWNINQQMGSRWPIACVAVEITQRCNLDCTLCYLSEHSESIHDLPLDEVLRRIEQVYRYYGKNTDIQVTGGEPTLRKPDELCAIIARIRKLGMRATLMTNGIRASRSLLEKLCQAGLTDVAFHVDTTQQRQGYSTELELNVIRRAYLEKVKGLPLSVMFNTTLHEGNYHELPELVRFFCDHATQLRTASFQLQADTGRGTLTTRAVDITLKNTVERINQGSGTVLNFDAVQAGHPNCNRYALALVINNQAHNFYDDNRLFGQVLRASKTVNWQRNQPVQSVYRFGLWLLKHPSIALRLAVWGSRRLWQLKRALIASRGKATTLSFIVHNFMDASQLDQERVACCVFNTMTRDGPISMCLHNAKRDGFIHQAIQTSEGKYWSPVTGSLSGTEQILEVIPVDQLPSRFLKGRSRNIN